MAATPTQPYRLIVLGTRDLCAPDGSRVSSVITQPKRHCLLTYLTLSATPVSRSALVALFWPESDEAQARNALSQAAFYLRRSLGREIVQSVEGDWLRVDPEAITCDALELLRGDAVDTDLVEAARRGFFEGWNADDSQPLQEWLDSTRRDVSGRAEEAAAALSAEEAAALAAEAAREAAAAAPRGQNTGRAGAGERLTRRVAHRPIGPRAAGVLAAAAAAVLLATPFLLRTSDPPIAGVESILLLDPRVEAEEDTPVLFGSFIRGEVTDRLLDLEDIEVVPEEVGGSLEDVRRQLAAIGASEQDGPHWILEVTVHLSGAEASMSTLLYRAYAGPGFVSVGRTSLGRPFTDDQQLLREVAPQIADSVVAMVRESLRVERTGAAASRR